MVFYISSSQSSWYCDLSLLCFNCLFFSVFFFFIFFFFFSSRRRHTRLTCDWSSDVCSSDLKWNCSGSVLEMSNKRPGRPPRAGTKATERLEVRVTLDELRAVQRLARERSEERRVGKECRSRWAPDHEKKKKRR